MDIRLETKRFKVHLDGYNFLPYLTGKQKKGSRHEVFYFTGRRRSQRVALSRLEIGIFGTTTERNVWDCGLTRFTPLRLPLVFNLRRDPYERSQVTSNTYLRLVN